MASSATDVFGLRVLILKQDGNPVQTSPGNPIFDCTAAVASLALDLLECRSSVTALKTITREIVETCSHIPELRNLKNPETETKVRQYLQSIRSSFPHVVVSNKFGMATKNGRTNKRDCQGPFEPKRAAVVELNETNNQLRDDD
ncbi:hypothetical protein VTK26DRAFT_8321 [Humicola hyalothermophila]